jgi:hypothetical protein
VGKLGAANPSRAVTILTRLLSKRAEQPLVDAVVRALQGSLDGRTSWPPRAAPALATLRTVLNGAVRAAKPDVRAAAIYALGVAGDLEPVRAALRVPDHRRVCLAALRVLSFTTALEAGDEAACRRLLQDTQDSAARAAALRVLVTHDALAAPDVVAELCAEDGSRDEEDVPAVLRACGAEHLVPIVRYVLTAAQPEVGRAVFRTLFPVEDAGKLSRARGGKEVLRIAAAHADGHIRAHAVGLIGEAHAGWGRTILLRACDDTEARVRVRAINGLGQSRLLALHSDHVRRHLADAGGWVRVAAIETLGGGGCLDATQLLAALRDDFPPAAVAGARAAVALCKSGSSEYTGAVQAALARLAETDYGRDDPVVARWRLQPAGA